MSLFYLTLIFQIPWPIRPCRPSSLSYYPCRFTKPSTIFGRKKATSPVATKVYLLKERSYENSCCKLIASKHSKPKLLFILSPLHSHCGLFWYFSFCTFHVIKNGKELENNIMPRRGQDAISNLKKNKQNRCHFWPMREKISTIKVDQTDPQFLKHSTVSMIKRASSVCMSKPDVAAKSSIPNFLLSISNIFFQAQLCGTSLRFSILSLSSLLHT